MSGIIGYVGQAPCNEFILKWASSLHYGGNKNISVGFILDEAISVMKSRDINAIKSELSGKNEIYSTLIEIGDNYNSSLQYNDKFIVGCDTGLTNECNITLPFNLFKKPLNTEDTMLNILNYLDSCGKSEIIKLTNQSLVGDLSFAYYDKRDNAIYCQMGQSPIIIGLGDKFNIISSEIIAITSVTNRFIALQTGEKAKITKDRVIIYNAKNHKIKKTILKLNKALQIDKDFSINEQLYTLSSSISTIIDSFIKNDKICFSKTKINKFNAKTYARIVILSDSESYYACISAKNILTVLCDLPIEVYNANEYVRQNKSLESNTLLLAVSLIGECTSLNISVKYAQKCSCKVIAVTANTLSSLYRLCDYSIVTPEPNYDAANSISLNAFSIAYLSLCFFALYLGHTIGVVSDVYTDVALKMAQMLPGKIAQGTKKTPFINKYSRIINACDNVIFTACGVDYGISCDASQKLSILAKKPIKCLNLFDINKEYIEPKSLIIAVITNKDYIFEYKNILKEIEQTGAKIILITNSNIEGMLDDFEHSICIPDSLPIYNILPANALLQSLALSINEIKNDKEESVAI